MVVVQHIPLVIAAGVVSLPHAHGVMREVNIAIVACLGSAFVSVRKGAVGMFGGGISCKWKSGGMRAGETYRRVRGGQFNSKRV